MKRIMALLAVATLFVAANHVQADSEHHKKVRLESINGSGISGWVNIVQLPHGGSNIVVTVEGLKRGASYASFYYESSDCNAPADDFQEFTGGDDGTATLHGKIDDDLDEVGSVSVRVGPGYGDLLACADVAAAAQE
jgi:hypothetical protein